MKPNELSLKPKSTVKNVWPRMNNVPAPIKQDEIEKAIFLIFFGFKKVINTFLKILYRKWRITTCCIYIFIF